MLTNRFKRNAICKVIDLGTMRQLRTIPGIVCLLVSLLLSTPGDAQIITTVAGTGTKGFSGDGGAATSAQLAHPIDVFVGESGSYYISDRVNGRIRKVDAAGIITTVVSGLNLPFGIFVDGSGDIYIAGGSSNTVFP